MGATRIEWTESTWNPVTGCTKISKGCFNCYAERMAFRLQAMGQPNYANGFTVTCHPQVVNLPLKWKKSQMIFVNSMSDLFHEQVPSSFRTDIFRIMREAYWHRFQILTKRSAQLASLSSDLGWSDNIWMGVTVEAEEYKQRIEHLKECGAHIRFLSLEPLLGPINNIDLTGIDWVIVGGESGPGARPMEEKWVLDIREQCINARVKFFFKQWGGIHKKRNGRLLQGRTWDETPSTGLVTAQ